MKSKQKIKDKKYKNHLNGEKSPYLLQHADNPVDWYPWGDEAFKKARKENKLIFLSIGYSTCHWCHVMAHESFEDLEVAELMNEVFVSVKVDREERPDLDGLYMTVCQMMTGIGGWPLTIIMTPERKPFFAGTYFPKESGYGNVGLIDLIQNVGDIWKESPKKVLSSANEITDALKKLSTILEGAEGDELDASILDETYNELLNSFDDLYGGFGVVQKFPSPHILLFLMRYWKRTNNEKALNMVELTLDSMRNGGIYDHVGFGFHRYSVDQGWLVPHFEKMLYDQAMIAMAYTEAFQATGKEKYRKTAEEIFEYVIRDMKAPGGGFYSAEDADSEGVEGKSYLWRKKEIFEVLDEDEAEFIAKIFNIKEEGNFEEEASGIKTGDNIPHLKKSKEELAKEFKISEDKIEDKIENARKKLYYYRKKRIHPHKDDKILADWNGLMIAALSKGAQVFGNKKYAIAAKEALDFILNTMCKNNRLLHRYRDNQATITANLDDYSFMIWGLLELYETNFDLKYLKSAISLNNILLNHFWDNEAGGFYFTPDDGEILLIRKKESYDTAIPSGNSVEMLNLIRLARLTENPKLGGMAVEIERVFSKKIKRSPAAHTQVMVAVDFKLGPSYEVVIAGEPDNDDTKLMIENLRKYFIPNKTVVLKSKENANKLKEIAKSLKFKESIEGKATSYICSQGTCKIPTTDIGEMLNLLDVD
ncbi:MAG: thioredoxin domain-containing protein [Euryarchaeota archaeon]|nr:thioredoxin domain-containing protein [Euryarchaeota archaeon]